MENQSLSVAARLIALLLCSLPALAAEGDAAAERQQRLDRAATLKADAAARKQRADALLEQQQLDCAKRFFVNSCRDEAKAEHLQTTLEARRLEDEADALERQARREEAAERERLRAAEAERKAAELAGRADAVAAERQAADAARSKRLADKERKAAEGARRKAEEAEQQRRKQADHAARVAKKKQQAEQK